ncbi:NAD(P)H-dependent flavin oxidoreductase [Rhodococcus opacus]|uniref:NAD(P)H-dependent flavin oxidoreductase n=1 Tax=Rhodococcus opacus TaxID=37919 RepID=UPI00155A640E|nr:nitronate monooxygenase [Rhodococcus opacus]
MKTDLTDRLGIAHPVVAAGMARVAQAPLAAAVSEAGGMGTLGGVSFLPDALRAEIQQIKKTTDRPFAVNLLVPPTLTDTSAGIWEPVTELWNGLTPEERGKLVGIEALLTPGAVQGQVEVVLDEAPAVVVLTFDSPTWFIDECHNRNIAVMSLVGSVSRAIDAEKAGVDFVVAQGTEGGGHTGHVGTMALIPAVVDAVTVPVLAAGGIVDGRGLAAARCLGAAGVWMGTRFIASDEAYGHRAYKQRVLDAGSRDTILSRSYTGKPLRTLRNAWTTEWETRSEDIKSFPAQYAVAGTRVETGYQDGDTAQGMMPAGQAVQLLHDIQPAGDIVREIVEQADRILAGFGH